MVMTVFGTRPQFIKCALVSNEIRHRGIKEILVNTGQHYDKNMSSDFAKELRLPAIDYNMGIGSDTPTKQISKMMCELDKIISDKVIKFGIVYGDTNSTLAAALTFAKNNIKIIHVEAGVRSYDLNMQEEQNRIITDGVSSILCTPTRDAIKNLHKEGIKIGIYDTGDVMYDLIMQKKNHIKRYHQINNPYILVTIHRAENTNGPDKIRTIMRGFFLSRKRVIWPIHPRTRKLILEYKIKIPNNVDIIDPVCYNQMLELELNAEKIVTDSGGIQKEAYMLGVPCITLRNNSEWMETIRDGMNELILSNSINKKHHVKKPKQFYGDGKAHKKIVDIIEALS